VDIKGIDNHHLTNLQKGPAIAIIHQYALLDKGSSVHSPCQLESYHNDVHDKSIHVSGGLQQIKTLDGYVILLVVQAGLARLPICPYTVTEWCSVSHVLLPSEE
jgi:hypothetical protein